EQIDHIVRGPQDRHDLVVVRRYFRAYLHCWKTLLHFIRIAKQLEVGRNDKKWIAWCRRWSEHLTKGEQEVFEQLRVLRDHDTHQGLVEVTGEVAAGLFPIVMLVSPTPPHLRTELISTTAVG